MKTALRNANPALADTLLQVLDPPRKQSHTYSVGGVLSVCTVKMGVRFSRVADTRCLTRSLARDTLGRRELVPTHTLDAARPGTRHVRHPGPLLRLGRLPSSCS